MKYYRRATNITGDLTYKIMIEKLRLMTAFDVKIDQKLGLKYRHVMYNRITQDINKVLLRVWDMVNDTTSSKNENF